MEFYDNLNNNITEFFSSNQYNKLLAKNSDIEIVSMFFEEKYDYSNDISKLIIEDKKLFLDIINRFRKIINESFIMLFSYEKIIELINILKDLFDFADSEKNTQKENLKSNNEYYIYAQNNELELQPNLHHQ